MIGPPLPPESETPLLLASGPSDHAGHMHGDGGDDDRPPAALGPDTPVRFSLRDLLLFLAMLAAGMAGYFALTHRIERLEDRLALHVANDLAVEAAMRAHEQLPAHIGTSERIQALRDRIEQCELQVRALDTELRGHEPRRGGTDR